MAQSRRRQGSEQAPRRASGGGAKKGGGGTFFLLLFALMACAGAAYVLFPDQVKELLGLAKPKQDQPDDQTTKKQPKDTDPKPIAKKDPINNTTPKETPKEAPKVKEPPKEAPKAKHTQEADALSALNEVRTAYRNFEWTKARTLANKIKRMDATGETIGKAEDIIENSHKLQNFMKDMTSDQYGMVRGIYTSGSVVQITYSNGKSINVVPIKTLNDKTIIKTTDPVKYVQNKINSGQVYLMNEAGISMEINQNMGVAVDPADMVTIKAENKATFSEKWSKVRANPILLNDPITLYEVARYSYEVGIDAPVTELLERALLLDPKLPESVQNDRATEYYQKMVRSLKAQRKKTAAGHLRYLREHFRDTYVFKEAEAYYQGENAQIVKMQKQQRLDKKRAKEQAINAAKAAAKKKNDAKKLAEIEEIEKADQKEERKYVADKGPAAGGNEGKADALHAEGMEYLEQALADGADRAGKKDALLKKAFQKLMMAKNIYIEIVEGGDDSVTQKMIDCGQDAYTAKKSMRP